MLKGYDIEFITLRDIEVIEEPKEMGNTPEENAIMKAEFYGQYGSSKKRVILYD